MPVGKEFGAQNNKSEILELSSEESEPLDIGSELRRNNKAHNSPNDSLNSFNLSPQKE